ncbi:MAG: DUF615 domain-containing protein [Betaproteobacteria bacterium]|nr:DUF615 domain-containing protein [Betaproteobacteria bacterium]MDE2622298.1 DUF615 domain-containing protein [Betaproteobacteria bacterium]
MESLQDLGTALSQLSPERIRELKLPEGLERALLEVKTFKSHGAVRRQMQYIGKLMREVDPAPLQAYLDRLQGRSREATAQLHLAEHWRDRMLESVDAVDDFAARYREADRQQLRQLSLGAQRERELQKPPRQFRALFRAISQILEAAASPGTETSDTETDADAP